MIAECRALSVRTHWAYLREWTTSPVRARLILVTVLAATAIAIIALGGFVAAAYLVAAGGVWIAVGTLLGLGWTGFATWLYGRRLWLEPHARHLERDRYHYSLPDDCMVFLLIHHHDCRAAVDRLEAVGFWGVRCGSGEQQPPLDKYDGHVNAHWTRQPAASQNVRDIATNALAAGGIDAWFAGGSNL